VGLSRLSKKQEMKMTSKDKPSDSKSQITDAELNKVSGGGIDPLINLTGPEVVKGPAGSITRLNPIIDPANPAIVPK
jgi:hypothetical protein